MLPALTAFATPFDLWRKWFDPRRRRDDALAGENTLERFDERPAGEILRDYAGSAAPYSLGHLLARHVARENDDWDIRMPLLGDIDALCAVHSRHDEVQQQRVRLCRRGAVESFAQTARLDYLGREQTLPQVIAERLAKQVMVIGDYEHHRAPPVGGGIGSGIDQSDRKTGR